MGCRIHRVEVEVDIVTLVLRLDVARVATLTVAALVDAPVSDGHHSFPTHPADDAHQARSDGAVGDGG